MVRGVGPQRKPRQKCALALHCQGVQKAPGGICAAGTSSTLGMWIYWGKFHFCRYLGPGKNYWFPPRCWVWLLLDGFFVPPPWPKQTNYKLWFQKHCKSLIVPALNWDTFFEDTICMFVSEFYMECWELFTDEPKSKCSLTNSGIHHGRQTCNVWWNKSVGKLLARGIFCTTLRWHWALQVQTSPSWNRAA